MYTQFITWHIIFGALRPLMTRTIADGSPHLNPLCRQCEELNRTSSASLVLW